MLRLPEREFIDYVYTKCVVVILAPYKHKIKVVCFFYSFKFLFIQVQLMMSSIKNQHANAFWFQKYF